MAVNLAPVDLPFLPPPDTVLDLPAPLSVNKTRKIDYAAMPAVKAWRENARKLLLVAWAGGKKPKKITGAFEAMLILSDESNIDLDNGIKQLLDYAKRLELIVDDSKKYFRRLTIEWGAAPEGCRLILRPMDARA